MIEVVQSLRDPDRQEGVLARIQQVMNSGQYAEGDQTLEAEENLRALLNSEVVALNSCGSALYIAVAWAISKGARRFAVQNNTFYASGAAVLEHDGEVYLVDSRPDCPSMSFDSLVEVCREEVIDAVILTHVGGWIARDVERIVNYCRSKKILLIEDCAHCFGVYTPKGDMACWSFYPTKAVPVGDAGALSTRNLEIEKFAREFRSYGKYREKSSIRYRRGMNLRISEYAAAVLNEQLGWLPDILRARERDAAKLSLIAPCLLKGASNYYKYPVDAELAMRYQTTGAVYRRSDQLADSLKHYGRGRLHTPVNLLNSVMWSNVHCCLPIGEGIYDSMSTEDIARQIEL